MTTFSDEVRAMVSPHKFGGSRRAAACYLLSLDSSYDECTGEVDAPDGWVARYGRTLLYCDSQGFVSCERAGSVEVARELFAAYDRDYFAWSTGPHCGAWTEDNHLDRGDIDCGCGWGAYCELSSEYVGPERRGA